MSLTVSGTEFAFHQHYQHRPQDNANQVHCIQTMALQDENDNADIYEMNKDTSVYKNNFWLVLIFMSWKYKHGRSRDLMFIFIVDILIALFS